MGRWQTLQTHPLVICDTGHNTGGWQYLAPQIANTPCKQLRVVFGMVDDKDIRTVMQMLPKQAVYYWTQASSHRAIPAERVQALGEELQLQGNAYPTVQAAFLQACADAHPNDFIFVGGSSYVVADLLLFRGF
jgi:dihydrofolate synthase/folylpolyglutamate synthase